MDVIEQLQGFEAAAGVLESEVLASRVSDYRPSLLDGLCVGGEVAWGCLGRRAEQANGARSPLTRATPVTLALRESLDWLLAPEPGGGPVEGAAGEILEVLARRGACFVSDLASATRRLPSDVEETLWTLAAMGRVTSDSMEPLRNRANGVQSKNGHRSLTRRDMLRRRPAPRRRQGYSRWSLLEPSDFAAPGTVDEESGVVELRAIQLLRRYGIVFPELLARESLAPRWRDLARVLRRMEARGEIRGGRFVTGFLGEQFALPEAVEQLRQINASQPTGRMEAVSACDPLNLAGILTTGDKTPAMPGNRIVFRDGVPVASLEGGKVVNRSDADQGTLAQAYSLLQLPRMVANQDNGARRQPARAAP